VTGTPLDGESRSLELDSEWYLILKFDNIGRWIFLYYPRIYRP